VTARADSARWRAGTKAATVAVCGVLPVFVLAVVVADLVDGGAGWPFREAFLGAAEAILRGESPYPDIDDASIAAGTAYVYPPLAALAVIPFTLVSEGVAAVGFASLLVFAVVATLFLLGVRDWRCYGVALLWPATLSAVHVENITLLLGLAAAIAWRFRDRPAGAWGLGASLAVKPLLWPLGPWLAGTRRLGAVLWAAVVAVGLALGAWAVIGFAGLVEYEALVRRLGEVMDEWGYTVYALALDLGAGDAVARLVWLLLAAGLLGATFVVSRRGHDRHGFILAMAAVIACSPIVWLHYFGLLLVVVAVAQPRLGALWFVPLALYGAEEVQNGTTFQTALVLAAAALTVAGALRVAGERQEAVVMDDASPETASTMVVAVEPR
jgi:hypothetical protein